MLGSLGPTEIILIFLAIVLLFGAKRLPDTARSLGKSMRIFRSETRAMRDDEEDVRTVTPEPPRGIEAVPPRVTETHTTETRVTGARPVNDTGNAER